MEIPLPVALALVLSVVVLWVPYFISSVGGRPADTPSSHGGSRW
jgi:hypothetical protein